jgi:iron complex outermembrane recepter protein
MKAAFTLLKLFFFIIMSSRLAHAQKIQFFDSEKYIPVTGVEVRGMNNVLIAVSTEEGIVELKDSLNTKVKVNHISYLPIIINLKRQGNTQIQKVYLHLSPNYLEEVSVLGYDSRRGILETSGSIGSISAKDIYRVSETSPVAAFNNIAGVRMEERSPGSYRLSIRGSLLRSPFGVRNVKVYWNNIPFTEPGGNTPFNLLDISSMDDIEILKGPAGSIFGAGTGGVVNISSFEPENKNYMQSTITAGSFGLLRYSGAVRYSDEKQKLSLNYSSMASDGYREHSALKRKTFDLNYKNKISEKIKIGTSLLYSDLSYQIPGGITLQEFNENPKQARAGSIARNSSINLENIMLSTSGDFNILPTLENTTLFYLTNSFFDHPFISDYKRDQLNGYGGRTKFTYKPSVSIPLKVSAGGEYQVLNVVARNYGNRNGLVDTLRFEDEIATKQLTLFSQAELDLAHNFFLTTGLSINSLNYDVYRLQDKISNNPLRFSREVKPVISPRVGLVKKFTSRVSTFASISHGFSPPTVQEIRTNEGSINDDLQAERGFNYETGFKGNFLNGLLNLEMSAFSMQLKETIVSKVSEGGVTLFRNAGNTNQRGLEAQADAFLIEDPLKFISRFKVSSSFTYYKFRFRNYVIGENDHSGNRLTGVPDRIFTLGINMESRIGMYFSSNYNFTGDIPLNDSNTVLADSYNLIIAKAGLRRTLGTKLEFDLSGGIDNLLDQKYSLGNDLNAFGGRFFQAAPGRNFFYSLKFRYLIN